jgi:hypothetical protein
MRPIAGPLGAIEWRSGSNVLQASVITSNRRANGLKQPESLFLLYLSSLSGEQGSFLDGY